ncbi:MAG: PilZ domain-containing protein [Saprospiraceae bacterium]|nr:PilZ domain-containing protein [Pyrinomonadaceae bacterium]
MSAAAEILTESSFPVSISLQTVVKVKESNDSSWKEVADVVTVSSSGAGFNLKRECNVGHLVSLMLPLPAHQRSYDHEKELYRVWGLVQHCHEIVGEEEAGFHVGVAFIGKNAPDSYRSDPSQNYRICGMSDNGLWKVQESIAPFKTRKDMRFWKSIDLYLALVESDKSSLTGEKTVTENISQSGAAVISSLDVNVGDRVKFISEAYDFSGLAVVCNRQIGGDLRTRLHLQFVENKFPIESINFEHPEAAEN